MKTEDGWGIVSRHFVDVFNESLVLKVVWDVVIELGNGVVEAIVLAQAVFVDPSVTVGGEELSIEVVSDSSTILYLSNHVSDCLP